jgi:RimJ/RimL family protein N-acetyltransferase
MLNGKKVTLRRVTDDDWKQIEVWAQDRDALFGAHQRFQVELLSELKEAYRKTGLLSRESAVLIIEVVDGKRAIGVVRYRPLAFPETADPGARGKGYAKEALNLLVRYLYESQPGERIMAVTDSENAASQRILESVGFRREGVLRRAMFRGDRWSDAFVYGLLREDLKNEP